MATEELAVIVRTCDAAGEFPKSGQPRLGHPTAEDAKVRREKPVLIVLCAPAAPSAFGIKATPGDRLCVR